MSLSGFIAEQQSPAEMAKSMGLQSDGSGGYVDPESGQVVARTVNNELVFYDPMGGAISAQSDGAALTQAQPSWKDPVTGEITVPPGQAESPEEIAAIPDVVPAQAPASYNAFMTKKKKDMYASQEPPQQEEEAPQEEEPEMQPEMGMQGEGLTYEKLTEKAAPIKKSVDPNLIDPKIAAQAKAREADAAKDAPYQSTEHQELQEMTFKIEEINLLPNLLRQLLLLQNQRLFKSLRLIDHLSLINQHLMSIENNTIG